MMAIFDDLRNRFSILTHTGRHKGIPIKALVLAMYVDDLILFPRPYEEHVDWLKKVLVAYAGDFLYKGEAMRANVPWVIQA